MLQANRLCGDPNKLGQKPWISEMYGYIYAAARHNMWHHTDFTSMLIPTYVPIKTGTKVIHYGNEHFVNLTDGTSYNFDKHWFMDFNFTKCPPWNDLNAKSFEGLFQLPPSPSRLLPERVRRLRSLFVFRLTHPTSDRAKRFNTQDSAVFFFQAHLKFMFMQC